MPIITQTESSRSAPPIMGLSLRTGWMVESRQLVKTGPSATKNHRFAVKNGQYLLRKAKRRAGPLVNSIQDFGARCWFKLIYKFRRNNSAAATVHTEAMKEATN